MKYEFEVNKKFEIEERNVRNVSPYVKISDDAYKNCIVYLYDKNFINREGYLVNIGTFIMDMINNRIKLFIAEKDIDNIRIDINEIIIKDKKIVDFNYVDNFYIGLSVVFEIIYDEYGLFDAWQR